MKKLINRLAMLLAIGLVVFSACKKTDYVEKPPVPIPGGGNNKGFIQFSFDSIPLEPSNGQLYAIISVADANGQLVLSDKKLPLHVKEKYVSDSIELTKGNYSLRKVFIVNDTGLIRFAAPVANSTKASQVSKPLNIAFSPSISAHLPVQLVRVLRNDQAESFGYPAGAFGRRGSDDVDNNPFIKIRVRVSVKIGDIVYDSIPSGLVVTSWVSDEQRNTAYLKLEPGVNEISLTKANAKFDLRASAWGRYYQISLSQAEIKENELYIIGGEQAAKKLENELSYILTDGKYIPETRNIYRYNSAGQLLQVEHYKNGHDQQRWTRTIDRFIYSNNRVEKIEYYNQDEIVNGSTSFTYDLENRIIRMEEKKDNDITTAAVEYTNLANRADVKTSYLYRKTGITMNYFQSFIGGNMVADNSYTENHTNVTGSYRYDFNINPYAHMGWPDLSLSHNSKSNVIGQQKYYQYAWPEAEAYEFNYKYDSDGYPTELVQQLRNPMTKEHMSTVKTVYSY